MQIVDQPAHDDMPLGAAWACLGYSLREFSFMLAHGGAKFFGPMYPTAAAAYSAAIDYASQQQIDLLYWVGGRGDTQKDIAPQADRCYPITSRWQPLALRVEAPPSEAPAFYPVSYSEGPSIVRYKLPEDTSFRLRMNAALLAAAQDRAAREGRSMSALVRDALRRELELAA